MAKEIEIPEGYEAIIERNKVILEQKKNKIEIGTLVTAELCPTKVTVIGTFQGYDLEDHEDPTSICGKVFYVNDGIQHLNFVYVDSIKVCDGEEDRIRKAIGYAICAAAHEDGTLINDVTRDKALAYLEKQKEQESLPLDLSIEDVETIKTALRVSGLEFTANQKVYDKLEKIPASAYYLSTIGRSELYPDGRSERHIIGYLEKQKEHEPNIELIQKSWYLEGYHDGKYNNEPKWLIQTDKGVPRYEENPKYGTQKPAQYDLDVLEKHITKDSISELAHTVIIRNGWDIVEKEHKPAEWCEEDEEMFDNILLDLSDRREKFKVDNEPQFALDEQKCIDWFQELPNRFDLQPKQEWSEEDNLFLNICKNALGKYERSEQWDANIISKWLEEHVKVTPNNPHWKPSEEQMNEYSYWYKNFIESGLASPSSKAVTVLGELLEQLKRL